MTRQWRRRLIFALVASAAVFASLAIAGTRPEPLLIVVVFAVLATVGWLSLDLSRDVEPAFWNVSFRDPAAGRGADARVAVLSRRITESASIKHQSAQLHAVLLGVVDDRLRANYGINLRADRAAASRVLGKELSRYIFDPKSAESPKKLPAIEAILTRIEAL